MTKQNYFLFAAGLLVIILGYIFLSIGPATSIWSWDIAPIILTIGYVVIIPVSIMLKKKKS
jgi:hypothetical protein